MGIHNCSKEGGVCRNTDGNVSCSCGDCYRGDGISCSVIDCGNVTEPTHGAVNASQTTCGSNVTFSCGDAFRLVGPRKRTCLSSGTWTGKDPVCKGGCSMSYMSFIVTRSFCLANLGNW